MAAVRGVVNQSYFGSSVSTATLPVPPQTQQGDLLIAYYLASRNDRQINDGGQVGGWRRITATTTNTRAHTVMWKIAGANEPSSYEMVLQSSAGVALNWSMVVVAISGHGLTQQSDFIVNPWWTRGNNGGNQTLVRAPSLSAAANTVVFALTGEASNADGGYTVTQQSGFTKIGEVVERTPPASGIEWNTMWMKSMSSAGDTGDVVLDYAAGTATANGGGVQFSIPDGVAAPPPATGLIGAHGIFSFSSTSLTVGVDAIGSATGARVVVLQTAAGVEITRQTITHDSLSGWGNVTFTGLTPNTSYQVRFLANSVLQTDASITARTMPGPGPVSHVILTGSCQFTGSDHQIFDRMREENALFLAHQGDIHYQDSQTEAGWREGMETSLTAPRFRALLETTPMTWSMDNHDRIITDPIPGTSALNLGATDPATAATWKQMAGASGWASSSTLGKAWRVGRVLYVQTDLWSVRDDPDGPEPKTFLGATQKQWLKDTLEGTDATCIVWFCQWTNRNNANGRWASFAQESTELENWLNARPAVKAKMVMIGGDSHSLQASTGDYSGGTTGFYRFHGIPSLNMPGFNRSGGAGDGSDRWNIANRGTRGSGTSDPETWWGNYSRVEITDTGGELRFRWEAIQVDRFGVKNTLAWFEKSFGGQSSLYQSARLGTSPIQAVYSGTERIWRGQSFGAA